MTWARVGLQAIVLALAGLLIAVGGPVQAQRPNAVTVGLQLEPPTLDPTSGAAAPTKDVTFPTIYEGLVKLGAGGRVQPLLAIDWTVSPDGLDYTFHLRPGVRFQDGEPFDASSVKFSLDRAKAPASTNSQRARLEVIAEVRVLAPLTVQLRLKRRFGSLLQVLGLGDAAMTAPGSAATNAMHPVGTGPFRFRAWRRGYSVTLERNPAYWNVPARLARVTFRFIPDPTAALAALDAGDVDIFPQFPAPEGLKHLQRNPRFTVRIGPSEAEVIVALNNRVSPLNDVRVRRALSYAIDRGAIIDGAMFGYGQPIGSHYPPQDPGYVDLTGLYPHDPARARALLAQAGYPHGFELTLKLPPPPYARRSGEIVATELAEAGVRVRIVDVEWAQWLAQVYGRHDFDATIVAHVEPFDYDIYGRSGYYFGYDSAALRATLAALDDTTDPVRRNALVGEVQRRIAGDAVNLFLFEYPQIGVWTADLKNAWAPTPASVLDLASAHLEGVTGGFGDAVTEVSRPAPGWLWALPAIGIAGALAVALSRVSPTYLGGRRTTLAGTLLAASLVVFLLLQIAPGDPARFMMGMSAEPAALHALRMELGLNVPAWRRYLDWICGALRGDFGLSYTYRVPVGPLIAERLAVTSLLTLYALILSTCAAGAAALWSAERPGGKVDRIVGGLCQLGVAVPNFWLGMVLVLGVSEALRWLPAGGFPGWEAGLWVALRSLTLPALALAAPQAAVLTRVLRGELIAAMGSDYVRTARARGLSRRQALTRHALPNALVPVLTILGLQVSFLLAGAVVVENVFALPGLGRFLLESVTQRDLIVVQSIVLLLVLATTLTTFAVDLAAAAIDPRPSRDGRRGRS